MRRLSLLARRNNRGPLPLTPLVVTLSFFRLVPSLFAARWYRISEIIVTVRGLIFISPTLEGKARERLVLPGPRNLVSFLLPPSKKLPFREDEERRRKEGLNFPPLKKKKRRDHAMT